MNLIQPQLLGHSPELRFVRLAGEHLPSQHVAVLHAVHDNGLSKIHQSRMTGVGTFSFRVALCAALGPQGGVPGVLHAEIGEVAGLGHKGALSIHRYRRHPGSLRKTVLHLLQLFEIDNVQQFHIRLRPFRLSVCSVLQISP